MGAASSPNPAARKDGAAAARQCLAFLLGAETFAIEIRSIKEVVQYGNLTPVPLMPAFIRGVLNLRGVVVPVLDLGVRFGREPTAVTQRTCVVILELDQGGGPVVLGVLVDHVKAVLDIAEADIEPAPSFGSTLRADFIAGIGKADGAFVILLDVDHVLAVEELAALTATAEREPGP
jgi:purine-binding chemotaxis protein CheW